MSKDDEFKILVVEDDGDDVLALRRQISKSWPNIQIVHVDSLSDAYSQYMKGDFDLVFLDLNLPDGYGALTVSEMRKFNRATPIIAMTGHLNNQVFDEAVKGGAVHVISKSQINSDDFLDILREHAKPLTA